MLILSRKNGQKIIINDEIEITIIESKNDNCKIAINAPKDVKIYLANIFSLIKEFGFEELEIDVPNYSERLTLK